MKAAVEKTRAQKSYSAAFSGVIKIPDSSPMELKGEVVWVSPGVLFTQYTASGGDEVRIIRVGDKVWMYHLQTEEWVPAAQAGKGGAGRGVQNPDEVLATIVQTVDRATGAGKMTVNDKPCDGIELKLDGEVIRKVMKEQGDTTGFDWARSSGAVRLAVGGDDLIQQVRVEALIALSDPAMKDKERRASYTAEVRVRSFNTDFSMEFSEIDPRTKKAIPIPIPARILDEIEKLKGIPDPLKAAVQKWRAKKPGS
jgi:hypothetical protein